MIKLHNLYIIPIYNRNIMYDIYFHHPRRTQQKKTQSNLKTGVVFIDISKSLDISVTKISIILCKHSNVFGHQNDGFQYETNIIDDQYDG